MGEVTWQKDTVWSLLTVKDAFVCQRMCQETTEVLGCEMFTWNTITSKCTLSQTCDLIYIGYDISGPKECPTILTKAPWSFVLMKLSYII